MSNSTDFAQSETGLGFAAAASDFTGRALSATSGDTLSSVGSGAVDHAGRGASGSTTLLNSRVRAGVGEVATSLPSLLSIGLMMA